MTKMIEEAAREYADNAYYPAPDYGWYESDDEQMKEVLADAFKAGANRVYELPLSDRMTAEEKERVRRMYKGLKSLYAEQKGSVFRFAEVYKGKYELLESIFGADFFKEEG